MMKFKFQSFVDIQTSAESMQVIQWSVGGMNVLERCRHLFGAYKYFKLGKISIKMVPASTLPVDPQGLSYDADDPQTVDPRDQMNPGLVRITNGEDIFTNVSALSENDQIATYQSMMLDPRWSKFMLQSGFRRSAYPMYWQVGQLSQDKYPGATVNAPNVDSIPNGNAQSTWVFRDASASGTHRFNPTANASSPRGLFQVGHKGRLGYLPTDYYQLIGDANNNAVEVYGFNNVPEVSVITCVLPKAYKTIYYYRVFITEEVYFSGLRSAPWNGTTEGLPARIGIDNFLYGQPYPYVPDQAVGVPALPYNLTSTKMNNGGDLP